MFFIDSRDDGFTLLEIMIALAIIGITVTVVLHTLNYHSDLTFNNAHKTEMIMLAKEKISTMVISPADSSGDIEGTPFTFENIVTRTNNDSIIEIKTIIRDTDREIWMSELIMNPYEENVLEDDKSQ
jgi:prepilin-type N-terminal cleavage/methylation domain-containing protein